MTVVEINIRVSVFSCFCPDNPRSGRLKFKVMRMAELPVCAVHTVCVCRQVHVIKTHSVTH